MAAYYFRISDWSSDFCSSDLTPEMMVHRNMERRDRIDSLCFAAVSEPAISRSDMADFVRVDPPQYGGRSGVAGALQSPDRLGRDIQAARLQHLGNHGETGDQDRQSTRLNTRT